MMARAPRRFARWSPGRAALWSALVGLALGSGLLAGVAGSDAFTELMQFPGPGAHDHAHNHAPGLQLSEAGKRVASGLKCPCGCPDLLLACDCAKAGGATEVKRYITDLLAGGKSEADVRIELVNRYGAAIQRATR